MSGQNQPARPKTLDQITARLRNRVAALIKCDHDALIHALGAGDDLAEVKPLIGRGNWATYLTEIKVAPRTASRYMLLAKHRDLIEKQIGLQADFTIKDALKLISVPKKPKTEKLKFFAEIEDPEALGKFLESRPDLFIKALKFAPKLNDEIVKPMRLTEKAAKLRRREANRQVTPLIGPNNRAVSIH